MIEPQFAIPDHCSLVADEKLARPLAQDRPPDLGGEDLVEVALNRWHVAINARAARRVHPQREGDQPKDRSAIIGARGCLKARQESGEALLA